MSAYTNSSKVRVAICGAGFSGALLARQLEQLENVDIVIFDSRQPNDFKSHWTQPLSGAGLNLNPNAVATLKEFDSEMHAAMTKVGYTRKNIRFAMFDESDSKNPSVRVDDIVKKDLSDTYGLCCRWDDANRTVQTSLKKTKILWARKVHGYELSDDGQKTCPNVKNLESGEDEGYGWFDLLIGCDGRYSDIRKQNEKSDIPVDFEDVCNFRILVPATEKESGFFNIDDLTLMYNIPVDRTMGAVSEMKSSPNEATECDSSMVDYSNVAFRGLARVGVLRCPPTELLNEGSIYMFGNFAIEGGKSVPDSSRTKEFIRELFMPSGGPSSLSPEGQFLHRVFNEEAEKMHWARFQHVPPKFFPGDEIVDNCHTLPVQPVLYLGDAAHAFSPALGQGATTSIEDAYAAAKVLVPALRSIQSTDAAYESVRDAVGRFAEYRRDRVEFIVDMSTRAGLHLLPGQPTDRLNKEISGWTDEGEWRESVRRMWKGYPRFDE